jgi:HSP20 family protein
VKRNEKTGKVHIHFVKTMVELFRSLAKHLIWANVTGMTQDDVKVSIRNSTFTLFGEKIWEEKEKDANYGHIEPSYGSYSRFSILSVNVKADKSKATCKNGTLKVTLPTGGESQPKEIPISIE